LYIVCVLTGFGLNRNPDRGGGPNYNITRLGKSFGVSRVRIIDNSTKSLEGIPILQAKQNSPVLITASLFLCRLPEIAT